MVIKTKALPAWAIKLMVAVQAVFLFTACATRERVVYLQPKAEQLDYSAYNSPRIQRDDLLTIIVSSGDPKAALMFNPQLGMQNNVANSQDLAFKPTYLVDEKGEIDFPVIGKVKLGGLTRLEAQALLKEKLAKYIVDGGVNLSFANFRVSVLGEVKSPGVYTLRQERITVLEALAQAGDMTKYGVRDNVLLVRERDGVKETHRLDLTSDSLLNSPYYYLTQNDVLYVEPNRSLIRDTNFGQNTSVFISITSLIITLVTLISR